MFFDLNSMRRGDLPRDEGAIARFIERTRSPLEPLKKKNDVIGIGAVYKKLITFLEGLSDVSQYRKELAALEHTHEYQFAAKFLDHLRVLEIFHMKSFIIGLNEHKNKAWWEAEVAKLKAPTAHEEEGHMHKRVLAWTTLVLQNHYTAAIQQQRWQDADMYVWASILIEPSKYQLEYVMAIVKARLGDKKAAIDALRRARKLGFGDLNKMKAEPAFEILKTEKEFQALASA